MDSGSKSDVTKPRLMGNNAMEAVNRTAEYAAKIVQLQEFIQERSNDAEVQKRVGKTLAAALMILRLMEAQGAQTRP